MAGLMAPLPAPEEIRTHSLNCRSGWHQLSGPALHPRLLLLKEGWELFRCGKRGVIPALSLSSRGREHHFYCELLSVNGLFPPA